MVRRKPLSRLSKKTLSARLGKEQRRAAKAEARLAMQAHTLNECVRATQRLSAADHALRRHLTKGEPVDLRAVRADTKDAFAALLWNLRAAGVWPKEAAQ